LNTWAHLAGTYDGATERLYVNGVQVASKAQTGSIISSANPLQIGGDKIYGQFFQGLIDEVRVYNRALTANEIQNDMNRPLAGSSPPAGPTISNIPDQSTAPNTPTPAIGFSVNDADTPASSLTVSGISANTALVPNANISFGGSGTNRTITLKPASGQTGTATITVSVSDGARTASDSFLLTVASQTGVTASFTNSSSITIPDSGASTPYPSTINISGMTGTIQKMTVGLRGFSHTWPNDVDVLLAGPAGQKGMIFFYVGGGNTVNNLNFTLGDSAASPLPSTGPLVSGTFKPTDLEPGDSMAPPAPVGPYASALAGFNGTSPNGIWSLYVMDDGPGDQGSFAGGWSLSVTTTNTSTMSAASIASSATSDNLPSISGTGQLRLTIENNGDSVILQANGIPGHPYVIESSGDLSSWQQAPAVADAVGVIRLTETRKERRFYRLLQ